MPERRAQPPADPVDGEGAPEPLHDPDPDDSSAAPGGDQDIDTAGTDADDDPLTRPKTPAKSRGSSTDDGRA
jgi:hypothetical protein